MAHGAKAKWVPDGVLSASTIPGALALAAHRRPQIPVEVHSAVNPAQTTIGELFEDSCRVAANLVGLGIEPGDVVAVQLPNWRECLIAHAATWLCGAVLLPIVPIYGPHEVRFILQQAAARVLITTRTLGKRDTSATVEAARNVASLRHCITVGDPFSGTMPFAKLLAGSVSADFAGVGHATDRCLLVYTSGTTAEPKGVQHSHASLLGELRSMDQMRKTAVSSTTLAVFPSGHIAGALGIVRLMTREAATVIMDAWDPVVAANLIAERRIGVSAGAPIHLSGILDVAESNALDLSSLLEYTTGAANVSSGLIRRANDHGIRAFRCYGSSEHPTISSGVPDDPLDKRADTDGRLAPGSEVRLVDDDGHDVPFGHDGEILTRGPELFTGYTELEQTRASFTDGWFRTGDVGRFDRDGYLTITDRKKDIIVRGGENISSKEVEDAISAHPAIADVAAIGTPDDRYGERVCAFVVVKPGQHFDVADASEHFQKCGLARQKTPERIVIVDELPRTASGKVQKHLLRRQVT